MSKNRWLRGVAILALTCSGRLIGAPVRLLYSVGLRNGADKSDGVTFRIALSETGKKWDVVAETHWKEERWSEEQAVDLSAFRGREIFVRFTTDPGETTTDDWACWGFPRLVEADTVLLDFTKSKIWRSGIVVAGREISPMPRSRTGATFLAGTLTCGNEARRGFFAHPPWRAGTVGGRSFAEFKIRVGGPGPAGPQRPPLPVSPPGKSPFPLGVAPCFRLESPIRIDGSLDDWPKDIMRAALSLRQRKQLAVDIRSHKPGWKGGWRGPDDFSAVVALAWDDENLYLAEVRWDDTLLFMDTMTEDFSGSDSLRIGIGKAPGGPMLTADDVVIAVNPEGEQGKPMVKFPTYGRPESPERDASAVVVAPVLYSNGYVMEVKVPFSVLGIAPKPGLNLAFQLFLTDSDTPMARHHELLWKPKTKARYWEAPVSFGRLTLCRNTFAWMEMTRDVYAVGEAPSPRVGVFSLTGELSAMVSGTLRQTSGGAITTFGPLNVRSGEPLVLPRLQRPGQTTLSDVFAAGDDRIVRERTLTVLRDPGHPNLLRLAAPAVVTPLPSSASEQARTRAAAADGSYRFEYRDGKNVLRYIWRPAPGFDFEIFRNERRLFKSDPAKNGPMILRAGTAVCPAETAPKLADVDFDGKSLSYTGIFEGGVRVSYRVGLHGRTLAVEVRSPQAVFPEVRGPLYGLKSDPLFVPYLEPRLRPLPLGDAYASSYADWTTTHATALGRLGSTRYTAKTDGTRNPLRERIYVTVSPDWLETLPNFPNPKSPFMDVLAKKVVLDWWTWPGSFEGGARYLRELKGYGLDELAIIYHVWQRHGYDNGLPEHVPAMKSMGGDAGMKILGGTARELGYLFALHENYIDYYPNYPKYTDDAVALDPGGRKIKGWYNPSTRMQAYRLKPTWIARYAEDQATQAHLRYRTSAGYLDVHSVNFPWQIDYDAGTEGAASFGFAYKTLTRLFEFMRKTHEGPIFGEGAYHSFWAGRIDGCEAQVDGRGGEIHPPLPDFDLLKVHPLTVNHGMGYYTRWHRLRRGTLTDEEMDKYRAFELIYGHAGFLNTGAFPKLTQVLREYYLVQPIQERYVPARAVEISYLFDKQWVSSTTACRTQAPRKVRVTYDNGLRIWVNDERPGWRVRGYSLPAYGFVAEGAGVEARTALSPNGLVGDYSETAERIFADPRGYEAMYTDKTPPVNIEPLPADFKATGPRTFDITYRWKVNATLDTDYIVFVHFTDAQGQRILWQNDHSPRTPTSKWQPGTQYDDGPWSVEVPPGIVPGTYRVGVGLFKRGLGRVKLIGDGHDQDRYWVGTIQVNTPPALLLFSPPTDTASREKPGRNPLGATIDFGTLVTDIAVRIDRLNDGLLIMPIPHGRRGKLRLRLAELLPGKAIKSVSVSALDAKKERLGPVSFTRTADAVAFETMRPEAWFYRLSIAMEGL
ncbi:MAG: hypothetical protein GXP31_00430 [Kiritimatiellaeota bacterium]|nr:hypothetical protein [Kiritimatiellota bacterium]